MVERKKFYFTKAALQGRKRPRSGKPAVAFYIGDHDQFATDMQRGEWFFLVAPNVYCGPYPHRTAAETAWKRTR